MWLTNKLNRFFLFGGKNLIGCLGDFTLASFDVVLAELQNDRNTLKTAANTPLYQIRISILSLTKKKKISFFLLSSMSLTNKSLKYRSGDMAMFNQQNHLLRNLLLLEFFF